MPRMKENFLFWLVPILLIVLLILLGVSRVFIAWGFTTTEALFLSFMLTLPTIGSLTVLYRFTNKKIVLPSSPRFLCIDRSLMGKIQAQVWVGLVGLYFSIVLTKYILIGDLVKILILVAIVAISAYFFLVILGISLRSGQGRNT
jgi:hypothetical protein